MVLWQRQDDINSDVRAEASDLSQLTWIAHRLPPTDHEMLRAAVQDYTTAVLAHEWPAQSTADTVPAWQASQYAISHLATTFSLDQQTTRVGRSSRPRCRCGSRLGHPAGQGQPFQVRMKL